MSKKWETSEGQKIHFFHQQYAHNKGATVAYFEAEDGTIHAAIGYCSERDHFCKAIGRSVSAGRLNSPKVADIVFVKKPGETATQAVARHYGF